MHVRQPRSTRLERDGEVGEDQVVANRTVSFHVLSRRVWNRADVEAKVVGHNLGAAPREAVEWPFGVAVPGFWRFRRQVEPVKQLGRPHGAQSRLAHAQARAVEVQLVDVLAR